jgi:histidinol phosphatase-like PHP family hydrolase
LDIALRKVDITSVDAVEGRNGRHKDIYNQPALEMAARYNLKTTGGSDAHAVDEIGTGVTIFESNITTEAELLNELKAGRFTSAQVRIRERWTWKQAEKG